MATVRLERFSQWKIQMTPIKSRTCYLAACSKIHAKHKNGLCVCVCVCVCVERRIVVY